MIVAVHQESLMFFSRWISTCRTGILFTLRQSSQRINFPWCDLWPRQRIKTDTYRASKEVPFARNTRPDYVFLIVTCAIITQALFSLMRRLLRGISTCWLELERENYHVSLFSLVFSVSHYKTFLSILQNWRKSSTEECIFDYLEFEIECRLTPPELLFRVFAGIRTVLTVWTTFFIDNYAENGVSFSRISGKSQSKITFLSIIESCFILRTWRSLSG